MAVIFLNRMRFMKPFYFTHDDGPPILPGMQQEPEVTASQSRPGHGLNRPGLEHDACGVGFLAEMEGRPSGRVMPLALTALARLGHRGAVDADGFEYAADRDEPADRALPGILRFGGLRAAAALAAPGPLLLHHTAGALDPTWAQRAYELEGHPAAFRTSAQRLSADEVARWVAS